MKTDSLAPDRASPALKGQVRLPDAACSRTGGFTRNAMTLYLHKFDEKDLDRAKLPDTCSRFVVYKCCEDEHGVIYLLTDQPVIYRGEVKEAA